VLVLRYRFSSIQQPVLPAEEKVQIETPAMILPSTHKQPEMIAEPVVTDDVETRKHMLEPEEQARVWDQLEDVMRSGKIFKDSSLNLDKLAGLSGLNKYHISETLNTFAQKSFYQYINEYRIGFATDQMKYLTEKGIPVNILSLAYDAGFNAKSSFNRYFKDITGQTPSEYLKSIGRPFQVSGYVNGALG